MKVKITIGFVLLAIGMSTISSTHLIIPAVIAIMGASLILIASKEHEDEE